MLRQLILLTSLSLAGLGGCESSAPDQAPPLTVPSGSRMIASGRFDKLVLSAPEGGTLYFVDDRSGDIVYTLPYPPNEQPFRLADAPDAFRSMFEMSHRYRIYLTSAQP
jgi:hypothetical protein